MKAFKVKKNGIRIGIIKVNDILIKELLSKKELDSSDMNQLYYTFKIGDTLTGVICNYETDPDRISIIKEEILRINNINNEQDIKVGDTLLLTGIPSSFIDQFYNSTIVNEILDKYNFIKTNKDLMIRDEGNETQMIAFDLVYDFISNYMETKYYLNPDYQERILNKLNLLYDTIQEYNNSSLEDKKKKVK